jgi:Major capsid protein N-terminus/Large eukaryotic DNA virus major capsid protein
MGGGLMQLVAYGSQDIYLTGQPQITFFKSVYRRHTNFAIESIQQTINGTVSPGARVSVTISRNGDLLKNLWVEYDPSALIGAGPSGSYIASNLSHSLFDQLELEIGGQLIDRQYGLWLTVWRNLSEPNYTGVQLPVTNSGLEPIYSGSGTNFNFPGKYQRMSYNHLGATLATTGTTNAPKKAYVPMAFWFCKNPGLAVPLIALQYHEVKFNIVFSQQASFLLPTGSPTVSLQSLAVYADYVYLDTTERRQFAQNAHEYLIDQLQFQQEAASTNASSTIRLNFNHPVKELVWCGTPVPVAYDNLCGNGPVVSGGATPRPIIGSVPTSAFNNTNLPAASTLTTKIVLNGTDRFTERHLTYFTRNQVWDTHTGYGATANIDSVGVYSFALRPEEHQPSGTCNFSRIDTAQLVFNNATLNNVAGINALTIFAVNYNVLRIMSGMGGLAYSN